MSDLTSGLSKGRDVKSDQSAQSKQFEFGGEIAWRPSSAYIENANLTDFMRRYGLESFEELMQRSTEDVAWFTDALLDYLNVQFYEPYSQVVDLSNGIQWPKWCIDGKLNVVHNCLDKYIGTPVEEQQALIWEGEGGEIRTLTYGELYRQVNQAANALRSLGLGKGDAIGVYMPMIPEIAVAVLAIAKIGAIFLPLFSGYGEGAVATRLSDADAKALFTADGFYRRGDALAMKPTADAAAEMVPSLEHMIVVKRVGMETPMAGGRDHWWHELVASQPKEAATERTNAEDILMVIYTSGTTGRPKGAVHTHCGFPVKATQDMTFGADVHSGELVYWMTDMGWMMGPWLVYGSLLRQARFLLYEGAPDFPGPDRVWDMVERHRVNVLGISPTLIRSLIPQGIEPIRTHDLSSLRIIASTGEPWKPKAWLWAFENICHNQVPIINYTGGTELSGGILMSNPLKPIKPCSFNAPCPGILADVLDEDGSSITNQVGELVIKTPWIGITRGFWKDPERYVETYWSRWPDVWVHGDWAAIDSDEQWYVLGRSDDTIKVAGKRLGPAEVEAIVVQHPNVVDAAAIGVPDEIKGSAVVLFVVLANGCEECDDLRQELRKLVIQEMGKPLAPSDILFVSDLPKTRNAKVMRRVIRSAYLGLDPGDLSSLVNPEAVEEIRQAR